MLRDALNDAYKTALRERDPLGTQTLRMVLAQMKDRDIAARPKGITAIPEDEILAMLQGMIKQRRESEGMYRQGNRADLADKEADEVAIIERFLPSQMDEAAVDQAIAEAIAATEAASQKDMGKVMAELKGRYAGAMDFAKASQRVKQRLS